MALASVGAPAKRSTPQARKGRAETSLVGISLFDTGLKVIAKFGSPDEIEPLSVGGGAVGPSGFGGTRGGAGAPVGGPGRSMPGRPGVPAGYGPAGGPRSAGPAAAGPAAMPSPIEIIGDAFGMGVSTDFQNVPRPGPGAPGVPGGPEFSGMPPGMMPTEGQPGMGAPAMPGLSKPGVPGGGGRVTGGGVSATGVIFTRWVYNRNNCRYGFVMDKFNRVVQIEAVGMSSRAIQTRRGIRFGSDFASVIKKYNAPDGYDISGDSILVRYLLRDRVAFRLSRLAPKKPHQVTGIVIAAGKS